MKRLFFVMFYIVFYAATLNAAFIEPQTIKSGTSYHVFDIRDEQEFKDQHIRNSVHVSFDFLLKQIDIKNFDDFFMFLTATGIQANSHIIISCDWTKDGIIRAGILAFFLGYAGFEKVDILQGGFKSWAKAGLPITTLGTELKPSGWIPNVRKDFFVEIGTKQMRQHLTDKNNILIDIRLAEAFFGADGSAGHIKTSKLFPWTLFFANTGSIVRNSEELKKMLKGLKVGPEKNIVLCLENTKEIYFTAFMLTRYLGYKKVRILKGGLEGWQQEGLIEQYRW